MVRLFNTVGPRQSAAYGMVIPRLVRQALAGEAVTIFGEGTQTRCFCHVTDVIRDLLALLDHSDAVDEEVSRLAGAVVDVWARPDFDTFVSVRELMPPGSG